MMDMFEKLTPGNWIAIAAIAVPVIIAAIVGLFKLLFSKKNPPSIAINKIDQPGSDNTAIIADDNKGNIAGRDINIGTKQKTSSFDQKIAVYKIIKAYVRYVWTNGDFEIKAETEFLDSTGEVSFIFGSDIKEYIDEIYNKCTNLHYLKKMESTLSGDSLETNLDKQSIIKDWFKKEVMGGLEERFAKYLSPA